MENLQQNLVSSTFPSSILMGFIFFGAGNIGDDLMIGGFSQALAQLKEKNRPQLYSFTQHDLASQKTRFPQISWSHTDEKKVSDPTQIECWAGVGDTPFQLTSGTWCLDLLLSDLEEIKKFRQRVLVGIGAETEIKSRVEDFAAIANSFDKIYTRDEHSTRILENWLKVKSDRLFTGSDLANISLPILLGNQTTEKKFELGLIVAGDTLSKKDITEIGKFITTQTEQVAFIAGETRIANYGERYIFRTLTRFPWSKVRKKATLQVPDYHSGSLYELIQPIVECETILSTRYHGLLTAAWAGCKVAAIARSSKVKALAQVLGVPYCELPVTVEKLESLRKEATIVSKDLLESLKDQAIQGINFSLGGTS